MESRPQRSLRDYVVIGCKGIAMGAADVVPGVSGGTIAFITGIYAELLHSLRNIGPQTLQVLFKEGIPAAWRQINGTFLLALFGGVLISLKTLATLIGLALAHYPILVWSFFFGLILASVVYFGRQQTGWGWSQWLGLIVGIAIVSVVAYAKPAQLPGHWWVLFLGGFVAICAMILPGISGSFILLLVGLYPVFLRAIQDLDLVALASFGAGCVCGLLVFSRFLSWLLDNYHKTTLAVLIGFLVGSLQVTWPWKITLETFVDRHGDVVPLVQQNVWPWQYATMSGDDPQWIFAILCAIGGFFLILSIEFLAGRGDPTTEQNVADSRSKA